MYCLWIYPYKLIDPITHKLEKDEIIYKTIQTPYTDRIDGRGIDNELIKSRYGSGFFGIYNPIDHDNIFTLDGGSQGFERGQILSIKI